mgnify:CR=1 FL=1
MKTVLPFAFEYGLSVEQFYFLLMNEAVFGQVRDITEAVSLSNAEVGWLVDNGPAFVLGQITNFLQNNNLQYAQSAEEAIHVHLHLLMTDPEFVQLNEAAAAWPVWMWDIALDILVEVGAGIAKKQLGITIGEDVKDAIRNCGGGDILGCVGNVVDVLRIFFPGLRLVDLSLDAIEFGEKANRVWKAVDRLQNFGDEFVSKVVVLVKNKTDNLLDSFRWKNADVGIEIFNVGSPQGFWNDFKASFPDITGPYNNPQNPETYKILSDSIQIEYYVESGTTGGPTIKAKLSNGYTIKFRLK